MDGWVGGFCFWLPPPARLASLQEEPSECSGWQSHFWQPVPPPRFQVSGAQRSQLWPTTPALQGHWPLCWSHAQSSGEEQADGSVPTGSHVHSGGGGGAGARPRRGTELNVTGAQWSTGNANKHTHSYSFGWQRCRSNPLCSAGTRSPRCGGGTGGRRPSGRHMTRGGARRCCRCTGRAGSGRRAPKGSRSDPGRTPHTWDLGKKSGK